MKFKKCIFGRNATKVIFSSQCIIAVEIRLFHSHGGDVNFDNVVNKVSANFLYCIDTDFLIVLICNA